MTDAGFGFYAALYLGGLYIAAFTICLIWGIGWIVYKLCTPSKINLHMSF